MQLSSSFHAAFIKLLCSCHQAVIELFVLCLFRKKNCLAFIETGIGIIWHFLKQKIELFGMWSNRIKNFWHGIFSNRN